MIVCVSANVCIHIIGLCIHVCLSPYAFKYACVPVSDTCAQYLFVSVIVWLHAPVHMCALLSSPS